MLFTSMVTQLTEDSWTIEQIVQDSSIKQVNIEVIDPISGEVQFLVTCAFCCDNEKRRLLEDLLTSVDESRVEQLLAQPLVLRLSAIS